MKLLTSFRFVAVPGCLLALAACSDGTAVSERAATAPESAPVVLGKVEQREFAPSIEGLATARALESVMVTAPVSGQVEAIHFQDGARASKGQPLVRLEDAEERAAFAAAQADAEQADSRLQRQRELGAKGLVSKDQLDEQARIQKSAQARLELARVRLEQRTVRAPFAGVLGFRQLSLGALLQPGSPIVSLDAVDTLRVEFSVAESLLTDLAIGASVSARAAAWPERVFQGAIRTIGSRVDEVTRAIPVQAHFDNRDGALKPGMLLAVTAQARSRTALFIPEAAVAPENSQQLVWRVTADNRAEKITVQLGSRVPGWVEVVSGLADGERIVLEGQSHLRPGRVVREAVPTPPGPG